MKPLSPTTNAASSQVRRPQPGFVQIKEQFSVAAPAATVWRVLNDPMQVASCIPGAALLETEAGRPLQGTMTVKFGPTVVTFKGEVTLQYDEAARTCTIDGRGLDQRGASRALANGMVTVSGEAETLVVVEGAYRMTGPLEGFARTGGVHVARALIAEFSANLARLVQQPAGAEGGQPTAAPAPAHNLNGFRLLRLMLAGFWRRLFAR